MPVRTSIRRNLTGAAYSPNGFSQAVMTEDRTHDVTHDPRTGGSDLDHSAIPTCIFISPYEGFVWIWIHRETTLLIILISVYFSFSEFYLLSFSEFEACGNSEFCFL